MLYALDVSGELNAVSQSDNKVTLFATTNDEMENYGIRANLVNEDYVIQILNSDNDWKDMGALKLQEMVRDFYLFGSVDDFSGEGFLQLASKNYIYYNNNKIYGGGNQVSGNFANIVEKKASEKNGNLYYIDNAIERPKTAAQIILSDPDLSSFADLLMEAELIDSVQIEHEQPGVKYPRILFMPSNDQWTVFAPTNDAIAQAISDGLIPEDKETLRNFIYYHFARNAVFDDGKLSGLISTNLIESVIGTDIVYKTLSVSNAIHSLAVTDNAGNKVTVSHSNADHLVETGVLHKISHVLIANP